MSDGQLEQGHIIIHATASLSLSKQEEWELLFHYVLQYPLVVKEAGSLKKTGIGVHIEVEIKKVK